ncbi:unnamed protein product [Effrenium voratum]|nr:unnamed protein product [Effrenium voratum]
MTGCDLRPPTQVEQHPQLCLSKFGEATWHLCEASEQSSGSGPVRKPDDDPYDDADCVLGADLAAPREPELNVRAKPEALTGLDLRSGRSGQSNFTPSWRLLEFSGREVAKAPAPAAAHRAAKAQQAKVKGQKRREVKAKLLTKVKAQPAKTLLLSPWEVALTSHDSCSFAPQQGASRALLLEPSHRELEEGKPEQLPEEPQQQQEPANEPADEPVEEAGGETEAESAVRPAEVPARPAVEDTQVVEARRLDHEECLQKQKLQLKWAELPLDPPCLVLVVCGLPLAEVLALRAVSSSALQWAMTGAIAHLGEVCKAHHRIRTRLWIQRLEEINRNTAEESVYDSKVRRLADDALRRRMEAEMADARQDMENRIRDFHVEVDRRMEAQAVRVHAIVEERVQQQLDTILVAEMEKVRVMVEERVQGRVRQAMSSPHARAEFGREELGNPLVVWICDSPFKGFGDRSPQVLVVLKGQRLSEALALALESGAELIAALDAVVEESKEPLEGNILYMHQSLEQNPKNLPKQRNLFSLAASLPLEDSVVIEVGFNAGHSSLLMLLAHPKLRIIAFDLAEHAYTRPCFDRLAAAFPGRLQLVPGRSQQTLTRWAKENSLRADLVHIDGDHAAPAAKADLQNARQAARGGAWVVFDDVCFTPLKAVWAEALASGLIVDPQVEFCPTNRHGIARYARSPRPREDPLDLLPVLSHRGRQRHVLVLAPTDHGQDSLLGYLTRHRLWRSEEKLVGAKKLLPSTTQRHQSPWISLPLRYEAPQDLPVLVNLVAPHFANFQQIKDCLPLCEGTLVVVDCAEGLNEDFCGVFGKAAEAGLAPVLFLNKLDKLLSLEPDNEQCYQRVWAIVDRLNSILQDFSRPPLDVQRIVFGRGSLSVAESIGGWGFRLEGLLKELGTRKAWSEEQVGRLLPRLWGDHFFNGKSWGSRRDPGDASERGFCKLVLQPLREIYAMLEAPDAANLARLRALGVMPREDLTGNAWKQSAVEAWLPLADVLLEAVAKTVPAPKEPPADAVFYAPHCVASSDGSCFAFGRLVPPQAVAQGIPQVTAAASARWLLNGPLAVSVTATPGSLLGVAVESPASGAVTVV